MKTELGEAAQQVSKARSPAAATKVEATSRWLAERDLLKGGARQAIEIDWEIRRRQEKEQYPAISIISVDDDAWSKADHFPAAYTFVLCLDRVPHSLWSQVFDREYHTAWYNMKRETFIAGDRITMIVADSDSLQGHIDFAKQLVQRTNDTFKNRIYP